MKKLLSEFREFISGGNVIDLAVAVVIGAAFKAVIDSFVTNIINGFLGALFGQPNFDNLTLTLGEGEVAYGAFLTQVVNFVIIGAALFVVIKAYNSLTTMRTRGKDAADAADAEAVETELELLTQIRDALVTRGDAA